MDRATNGQHEKPRVGAWRLTILTPNGAIHTSYHIGSTSYMPGLCAFVAGECARGGDPCQVEAVDMTAILDDIVEWADERAMAGLEGE